MKAGRHNIPLDITPDENQCRAAITLKQDDGTDIWTVPCNKRTHPPHDPHSFHMDWNDVFSDEPMIPDPPKYRIESVQDEQ